MCLSDILTAVAQECLNNHCQQLLDALDTLKRKYPNITLRHVVARVLVQKLKQKIPEMSQQERTTNALIAANRVFRDLQ